jgi:hypothetical protein
MFGLTAGYLLAFLLGMSIIIGLVVEGCADKWVKVRKEKELTRRAVEETERARVALDAKQAKYNARALAQWQPPRINP